MFLVVSYDIPDTRRRTRLHRALKGFGEWVQYSVFECILDEPEVRRLHAVVQGTIDADADHVRYYRLCEQCVAQIAAVGGTVTQFPPTHVV